MLKTSKAWRIIPRPLLETVLNNHVQHHRVNQPLILHGPRGVGKTTVILERLMENWNKGPHLTGYVDFAQSIKEHHPSHNASFPWSSWYSCSSPPPPLSLLKSHLDKCLESMAERGIQLGQITSHQIFTTLNKWHGLSHTLRHILQSSNPSSKIGALSSKASASVLWDRAVFAYSARLNTKEIEGLVGLDGDKKGMTVDERSYLKEAVIALRLAKEVISVQQQWRSNAIADLNKTGGISRSLMSSVTDWPYLLLELLSSASEIDHFQPKLVINNIEVLKNAVSTDDSTVCGPSYHDSLIWRMISLGANEMCLPIILVTSDSYYSYRAYIDFGFPDIFISRETFGWTSNEGKLHMVPDYFSASEWTIVTEVLGANSRHLFELHALKESDQYLNMMDHRRSTFEDIVDAYLAYLQITVVNPAMEKALSLLQQFALDAHNGKIPKDKLRFGAPWRHPPRIDDPIRRLEWAKVQLMDFVQSLVNAEFGLNYFADCSLEIFDDPSAVALLEVGVLYAQRDPSFIRPVSRGMQRCLVRWLVQEQLQLNWFTSLRFQWQRAIRGRFYRHLMLQIGYKY
ncbi:hypothetical protein BVRB_8g200550 [Beta vulgaris subsp. vulgaris]|uniref:Uncharacterized protein n=1 Tax=Beta vulgaris subsp. vulgaris TaxID=3555 RepID=A0A7G2RMM4_BETVV|nr:uncharacterized protein LOC104882849 isoform X1 [Beta vulgaris subsp. vulgaris]KMS96751.1 hypothetical protein BVRB_8g200550 [Beta vulgaris subsp. vulgaris]